ncbi:hypothetical protein [Nodosilinea sp. P-1105]|uniref:hypothetical protein n=1 Tax=Nodosilinea sp. P-1105 TaxID=2546229 RepID=UPI00146A3156|nr:hypothetical protein [Nodosilinea sp. P-1105]NMF82034.1 hypothetical protein [Nodosilinea sp. P-1105]
MLQYLEPGAGAVSGSASSLPPSASSPRPPRPEKVRHLLYGSLPALDRTIKILHALGYADPNDWSDPLPVPQSGGTPPAVSPSEQTPPNPVEGVPPSAVEVWMVILTKTLLLE